MKGLTKILCGASFLVLGPVAANAAGTYYTGNYQSPQVARYNNSSAVTGTMASGISPYNQARYNAAGYSSYANTNRYAAGSRVNSQARQSSASTQGVQKSAVAGNGFHLDAGMSYKTGMWQFEMKNAGSKLHYDNLAWGVLDVNGGYDFMVGKTPITINAGLEYGIQMGESTMIDDDISNGGYIAAEWWNADGTAVAYTQYGNALSVGTSKDGDMLGIRGEIGLKDFFTWGRVKVTPSIGWRHFKYKLETTDNYGLKVDTMGINGWTQSDSDNRLPCFSSDGMTQCWPFLAFLNAQGQYTPGVFEKIDLDGDGYTDVVGIPLANANGDWIDSLDTFYFHQNNMSHSYEVTWSGPYLALDMLYDINVNNSVSARVELGLPGYNATADQPYRTEWQHPKSIEDDAGIGSAFHMGLGAQWRTALTDKVSLSIGVTYDYYSVGGADATTYLNPTYWQEMYDTILKTYVEDPSLLFPSLPGLTFADAAQAEQAMLYSFEYNGKIYSADPTAVYISDVKANGWKDTVSDEIESFFKSLGVRVGITAKF